MAGKISEDSDATVTDAMIFAAVVSGGNVGPRGSSVKTWIKSWLAKADVGLGNVDNTSNSTERAASATLTNKTINGASNNLTVRLANDVTGTLPVANGGTGDTGTAWTSYTPTLVNGSGALTSATVTGVYKKIGKTVLLRIVINITTNGAGGSYLRTTAPSNFKAATPLPASRSDFAVVGGFGDAATPDIYLRMYDGTTYPGGDGRVIIVGGSYEEA